jgi:hypothetical protein
MLFGFGKSIYLREKNDTMSVSLYETHHDPSLSLRARCRWRRIYLSRGDKP